MMTKIRMWKIYLDSDVTKKLTWYYPLRALMSSEHDFSSIRGPEFERKYYFSMKDDDSTYLFNSSSVFIFIWTAITCDLLKTSV